MEKVMWTDLQGERSRLRGSQAATQERRMGGGGTVQVVLLQVGVLLLSPWRCRQC